MSDQTSTLITWGIVFILTIAFVVFLFFMPNEKDKHKDQVENFEPERPTNFKVLNYFPNHAIKMEGIKNTGETVVLIDRIEPLSSKGLTKRQVRDYLGPDSYFRFSLIMKNGTTQPVSTYQISGTLQDNERIKNLHVGMITTRYIADTTDSLQLVNVQANAGQGSAWLVIHNLTDLPLSFNKGEVTVNPHSTTRYLGYLNSGVTLGTYFKEDSGLFPDFQYLQPHNNLYYGVVSDIKQPLQGCLQETYNDDCEYGQTLWPFQDGII